MLYTTTSDADMRGAECVITDGQTLHESLRDVCNEGRLNNGGRIADKTRSTHEYPRGPTRTHPDEIVTMDNTFALVHATRDRRPQL